MADTKEPFYITTAINYTNGDPHMGHAYEAVTTDCIARFYRLAGRYVVRERESSARIGVCECV
jgi:methionyl-tRNA synthetase